MNQVTFLEISDAADSRHCGLKTSSNDLLTRLVNALPKKRVTKSTNVSYVQNQINVHSSSGFNRILFVPTKTILFPQRNQFVIRKSGKIGKS